MRKLSISSLPRKKPNRGAAYLNTPESVFVDQYSGSRVVKLNQPDLSNPLSLQTLGRIKNLLKSYENNIAVGAIFLASSSPSMFSNGPSDADLKNNKDILFKEVVEIIEANQSNQKTLSVFGGFSSGTAYSVFSSSKYLLGTPKTNIVVNDLSRGFLPFGGLAYRFAHGCSIGVEAARYFAYSAAPIYATDAFSLGLVTHCVEDEPFETLADALSQTVPQNFRTKCAQPDAVPAEALPELLEAMHGDCDIDVDKDEIWDKLLLVRGADDSYFNDPALVAGDIDVLEPDIKYCFAKDSNIIEILERLEEKRLSGNEFAANTLTNLIHIDPLIVKAWHKFTSFASSAPFNAVLEAEIRVNTRLLERSNLKRVDQSLTLIPPNDQLSTLLTSFSTVSDVEVDDLFRPMRTL